MIDLEATRVVAVGAATLAVGIGGSLTVAITGAMWEALYPGTPMRVWVSLVSWLSKALRAICLVVSLPYRVAVTYGHVGWRTQRHMFVTRGRHRPAYVRTHPWTPVRTWRVAL